MSTPPESFKKRPLSEGGYQDLPFLRRFRLLSYTLVLLSIMAFCIGEANFPLLFLALTGCALSWWIVESRSAKAHGARRPIPRYFINLGVLIAAAMLLWEYLVLGQENLLVVLGHFMIAILICKLFETKQDRDYAQILTLSLLIMVAATVAGLQAAVSIYFGLTLALYLAIGLYTILVFHLRHEISSAMAAGSAPAETYLSPDRQKRLKRDFRRLARRTTVLVTLFALGVFVAFPRTSGIAPAEMRTGFSDRMNFDDGFTNLLDNDSPALRVEIKGATPRGNPYSFEREDPYFRGLTFDRYDPARRQWIETAAPLESEPIATVGPEVKGSLHETFTILVNTNHVLFSLASEPGGNRSSRAMVPGKVELENLSTPRSVMYSHRDFSLRLASERFDHPGTSLKYQFYTLPGLAMPPEPAFVSYEDDVCVLPPDSGRRPIVTASVIQETVEPLLLEAIAQAQARARYAATNAPPFPSPAEVLRRARDCDLRPDEAETLARDIADFLRTNYYYSRTFAQTRRTDPLLDFLIRRRGLPEGGHCQYFAASMALLCRSAGLNARLVTGYHGGEYDPSDGSLLVRQKDAHAWVEIMIQGKGWILFDPTPPDTHTRAAGTSWLQSIRDFFSDLQNSWSARILNFDAGTRLYVMGLVAGLFRSIGEFFSEFFAGLAAGFAIFSWQARAWAAAGFLWCLLASLWLWRKWRWRHTSRLTRMNQQLDAKTQRQYEARFVFFDDLLRLLDRAELPRNPGDTPRDYILALAPTLGDARADALYLTDLFYAARFGQAPITPSQEAGIQKALAAVREKLKR